MNNFKHPEIKSNELFFTNATKEQFESIDLSTKRRGVEAYDGNGIALEISDWFPVFIDSRELEEDGTDLYTIRKEFRNKFSRK